MMKQFCFMLILLLGLTACSRDEQTSLPPQRWQDLEVVVETRPAPVQRGMNEFLVIVSKRGIRPREDLIVSLRLSPADPWHQAIQDGDTGVFRKALRVTPAHHALYVQIRRKQETGELAFPFSSAS